MSYTRFEYEALELDRTCIGPEDALRVTVTLRNAGDRAGRETVQLYLRDRTASVVRPVQQLIDYRKVELLPGERKAVEFLVTEKQLRFWNYDCQEVSEPGMFEISCGWADHLMLTREFELK